MVNFYSVSQKFEKSIKGNNDNNYFDKNHNCIDVDLFNIFISYAFNK